MNNNLTGITLSALVHVGVLSWATGISNDPVKKPLPLDNIALTVSLFEAEKAIIPPAPISAPSPVEKDVIKKTEPLAPITKLSPPIKIASLSPIPKIEPELKPEPIVAAVIEKKPTAKERVVTPTPVISKTIPKIVVSKKTKKPKKSTKKKIRTKKIAPKKVIRKTVKRRVIKKSAVIKNKVIPKRKTVAKAQPRPQAIVTPIKRRSIVTKPRKTGGVANKNKLNKPRKTNAQARKHTSSVPATSKQSFLNANLTKRYKSRLQQLIATKKRYPKRARRRGYQGKVTVSFKVIHSGIISEIKIVKASKHKDLNTATLNAIKQASGKLPYTKGMSKKALSLSVTLAYILR